MAAAEATLTAENTAAIGHSFVPEARAESAVDARVAARAAEIRAAAGGSRTGSPLDALRRTPGAETPAVRERKAGDVDTADAVRRYFGTEARPPEAGSPAEARQQAAATIEASLRTISESERGIDALSPTDRAGVVNTVIRLALDSRPMFASLTPNEKIAIAEGLLQNNDVRMQLGDAVQRRLNPETGIPIDAALTERFDQLFTDREVARADLALAERNLAASRADRAALQDSFRTRPDGSLGDNLQRIEDLEGTEWFREDELNRIQEYFEGQIRTGTMTGEQVDTLKADVYAMVENGTFPDTPTAEQQMMRGAIIDQQQQEELAALRERRAELPAELDRMRDEADRLREIRDVRRTAAQLAEDQFGAAEAEKAVQENRVIQQLLNVVDEPVNAELDRQVDVRAAAERARLTTEAENAATDDDRKMTEAIRDNMETQKMEKGRMVSKIDKAMTRRYYQELMLGGPEGLLRAMLLDKAQADLDRAYEERTINPGEATRIFDAAVARAESLRTNPGSPENAAFVEKHAENAAARVMENFILTGGRPVPDEVRRLRQTTFGKGLFTRAQAEVNGINKELAKKDEKGEVDRTAGQKWRKAMKNGLVFGPLGFLLTLVQVGKEIGNTDFH